MSHGCTRMLAACSFIRLSSEKGWESGEAGRGVREGRGRGFVQATLPVAAEVASLLGGLLLPGGCLLIALPGFVESTQIQIRLDHSRNQSREKQVLGDGWSGLVCRHPDLTGLSQGERALLPRS